MSDLGEARIKKIVNRRGQIRKVRTAGRKGKKVSNGRVTTVSGIEKRNQRLGLIKRRRTMKTKGNAAKKRAALFAKRGRARRRQMGVKDNRRG